jgi:hypothetical protein
MKRGTETETSPGGVSRAGFRGLRIETGRGVAGLVGLPTFVFSHAETQSHGERRRALCGSATPGEVHFPVVLLRGSAIPATPREIEGILHSDPRGFPPARVNAPPPETRPGNQPRHRVWLCA